jgi:hypothetical protein
VPARRDDPDVAQAYASLAATMGPAMQNLEQKAP